MDYHYYEMDSKWNEIFKVSAQTRQKMTMENVLAILEDNFWACFGVLERLKQLFCEI